MLGGHKFTTFAFSSYGVQQEGGWKVDERWVIQPSSLQRSPFLLLMQAAYDGVEGFSQSREYFGRLHDTVCSSCASWCESTWYEVLPSSYMGIIMKTWKSPSEDLLLLCETFDSNRTPNAHHTNPFTYLFSSISDRPVVNHTVLR